MSDGGKGRILSVPAMMATFAAYTVREMINNRLMLIAVFVSVFGLGLASFVADVAITEHKEVQLALVAASYRFCAVFVMMVFVVSTIVREFNDKCLELYLSMPVSRTIYFAGKAIGFILCGLMLSAIFAVVMLVYADFGPLVAWWVSLTLELAIVAVFAFFAALTFNQQLTAAVFTTFFFYLLSRMTDTIELISQSPILAETLGNNILEFILKVLELVLPKLSHFTKTDWLVYGGGIGEIPNLLASSAIYCVLIGALAMWDFVRKNL